jgi:hypothetical protein
MNRNLRCGMTLAVCLSAVLCWAASAFAADAAPNARTIMATVYRQDTHHDVTLTANFEVFDNQGHSTKKEFIFRRMGMPQNTKTEVVFTGPKEICGVALLSITQEGFPELQFVYTPATQRVRSVVPQERSARFIGTDFTFEDIGERVLDDFSYRLIDDTETMDGHKTYKVEATPLDASRSQYKNIYYWVAQDVPVVLFAEMYDAQGHKVRVLHATGIKRENGVWGARYTEMRTVADGTRTVLTIDSVKFDTKMNPQLLTPQGLAGALVAGKQTVAR